MESLLIANVLTTSLMFSGNICNPCLEHSTVLGNWLRWHRHLVGQMPWHLSIGRIVSHVISDRRNTSRCLIDRSSMFLSHHRGESGRIIAPSPHSSQFNSPLLSGWYLRVPDRALSTSKLVRYARRKLREDKIAENPLMNRWPRAYWFSEPC